ncbi:MAG: hypothetical protein R3C19_03825 [Planctomycetaceae bacterium]
MRVKSKPKADPPRRATLLQELSRAIASDVDCEVTPWTVRLTGRVSSWHDKQVASEVARRLFPEQRIDNQLVVTVPK